MAGILKAARLRVFDNIKRTRRAHDAVDLTYVTPRLVAMSFPATGMEETAKEVRAAEQACGALLGVLGDAARVARLQADKDFHLAYLRAEAGVGPDELGALLRLARLVFDAGAYAAALPLLRHFRALATDPAAAGNALWGIAACEILLEDGDAARESLAAIKELIDSKQGGSTTEKLQKRVCFAHWALFVCFGFTDGVELACDWLLDEKYLAPIHSATPHLLRYVLAAALMSARARNNVQRALDVTSRLDVAYADDGLGADPVVAFARAAVLSGDFDAARAELARCEQLAAADFFIGPHRERFMRAARTLLLERMCGVAHRLDVAHVATQLGLAEADAPAALADMISAAKLDAKLDGAQISVPLKVAAPHELIAAQTKALNVRSKALFAKLGRLQEASAGTAAAATETAAE